MDPCFHPQLGAHYLGQGRCQFLVWAPKAQTLEVQLLESPSRCVQLERDVWGYFSGTIEGIRPGARYLYRLDGQQAYPDPASRFQPQGVHGPSQVVEPDFPWTDTAWHGLPLQQLIIYELHVGTFSTAGTLAGVAEQLDRLQQLGVTAIELMPLAQFPGTRNWGYELRMETWVHRYSLCPIELV